MCINWTDDDERTHQANLMAQVCSRAQDVFLWLSDYAEDLLPETEDPENPFSSEYLFTGISATEGFDASPLGTTVASSVSRTLNRTDAVRFVSRISTNQHFDILQTTLRPRHIDVALEALNTLMDASW
jgi:hypothetical protein